jgi:signal transduction histidine kinase
MASATSSATTEAPAGAPGAERNSPPVGQADPRRRPRRARFGLQGRLALSHLAVIAVAMGLASFGLLALVRAYLLQSLQGQLEAQAELTAAALLADPAVQVQPPAADAAYNTLQQQQISNLAVLVENQAPVPGSEDAALLSPEAIRLSADLPTHVLVLNAQGEQIFQSLPPGPLGLRQSAAARSALSGDTGRSLLRGEGEEWLVLALPLRRQGELVGALALAHPLTDLNAVLGDTRARLLLAAVLGAALAGLLGLFLARRLVRPIAQLTAAAERLAMGDYAYPLPAGEGDELAALGTAFDGMRSALEHHERSRTQFISDISHELRTPLTGIKGLVETLQDGAAEDARVRGGFIASIGQETERLIRLTQDLLTLTRADEQALALRPEPLDLAALVGGVVARLLPEAERRGLRLEYRAPARPLPIRADPDRLEQVVLNLLDNALKHAPAGSAVTVAAAPEGSRWAVVHVRDRGPGIPAEALERVFDRFYRADAARDRGHGGSGLGLSIARALIEQHGGRIWVHSPRPGWDGLGPPGAEAGFALPTR